MRFWLQSFYLENMRYPNKRFPRRLGVYTHQIVKPLFKSRGLMEGRIITQWPHIVGEKFARLSLPEKVTFPRGKKSEGTLHIRVTSASSLLLHSIHDLILDHVNTFFGYKAIAKLYMIHGLIPSSFPAPSKPAPAPSPEDIAWVEAQTSALEDTELKECLENLGKALSAKDKI